MLTLWQVYELEGVVQLHNAHFWTLYTENYHGSLQLAVMAGTDMRRTLAAAKSILTQVGKFYILLKSLSYYCTSDYCGCAVLLCLVCLTLLASFFLLISH